MARVEAEAIRTLPDGSEEIVSIEQAGLVCEWFALCENPATHAQTHPVLVAVPCCDRCAEKIEACE